MRSAWLASIALAAGALCAPAAAQVRVIVDGQVQDVPDGVVRTISYEPGGRQTVHDEPFAGPAAPGSATVTTTETSDEDEDSTVIHTSVVTRIEPMIAVAYAPQVQQLSYLPYPPPPLPPPPQLDVDTAALDTPDQGAPAPKTLRIRRDPMTGHFIATIRINGVDVRAIVDTGAQSTILSARDARATGADRDISRSEPMAGIGGYTMLNVTRVRSMEVAGQQLGGFSAAIGQDGIPFTLLGQTEIARLGRIVIDDGVMTISPRNAQMASR